jgi:putative protease
MKECRKIELLAPAKTVEIGMEAIRHGADAVYIGAEKFGARAAAGNSLEDLASLVEYAHLFRVRVYVTVNTIFKDEELPVVEQLIWKLYRIGVDALIVQDLALLKLNLPPIPLHASTQMDNRSADSKIWMI